MIQDNTSGNKIKENKYKILRMSLLLGNGDDREETINNFEDAAREIDAMNDEIYLKDLENKFYDTLTLEEEEKKLTVLVDYIGGRVEQRLSLLSDFSNVTGFELTSLAPVKYYDKLDEYKERLGYIREYLDNIKNIDILKKEISEIEDKLNDTYVKKAKAEDKNVKDEAELLERFNNIIKRNDDLKDISLENASAKLNDIINLVQDSKKSLDIFDKSFNTLNSAGISGVEREEYLSYVNSAREAYYKDKEEEYLLRLYIYFNTTENEYSKILAKREAINYIIYERMDLRRDLEIKDNDNLNSIYDLLERQFDDIKKQKNNIDDIESLTNDINLRKDEVNRLEEDNKKVEIVSLLKEFCIIDTYDGNISKSDVSEDVIANDDNSGLENSNASLEKNNIFNDSLEITDVKDLDEPENEEVSIEIENAKDNQVVSVKNAKNINLEEAILKSSNVMRRVGEMLGVKIDDTKIVSVDSDEVSLKDDNLQKDIVFDNNMNKEAVKEETKDDVDIVSSDNLVDNNVNIFTNTRFDADPETSGNFDNSEDNMSINPLFSNSLGNSTIDDVMAKNKEEITNNDNDATNNNDFWFTGEDTPIDLNSLPDLSTNENSFFNTNFDSNVSNNSMPELNFPDLDMVNDDEEGK